MLRALSDATKINNFCRANIEIVTHLFLTYPFSHAVWTDIRLLQGQTYLWEGPSIGATLLKWTSYHDHKNHHKALPIWLDRNWVIFKYRTPSATKIAIQSLSIIDWFAKPGGKPVDSTPHLHIQTQNDSPWALFWWSLSRGPSPRRTLGNPLPICDAHHHFCSRSRRGYKYLHWAYESKTE